MSTLDSSKRPIFACIRCSERKVGCDKKTPCDTCIRHKAECIYRPPKTSRKRRQIEISESVEHRLKRYENLLREKGIDPHQVVAPPVEQSKEGGNSEEQDAVWKLPSQTKIFGPHLRYGQEGTELIDNSLWSRLAEEFDHASMPVESSDNDSSQDGARLDDYTYILGSKSADGALSHPSASQVRQLWKAFVENINPLTKVVHVPSLQTEIEKACENFKLIPRGLEAIMFTIYCLSVTSLMDDDCRRLLGEPRGSLLSRYVRATKIALSRADFLNTTNMIVLQALVLHIVTIRNIYQPRAVWVLIGLAIRIAEAMGLHIDGALLGLSSFETEIRRRIWWQLKMYDFRAAELCGQSKTRNIDTEETSPRIPGNINDNELYPTMSHPATESIKPTEMIWCMLRFELSNFAKIQKRKIIAKGVCKADENTLVDMNSGKAKDAVIIQLEDMFESKYLRFCDPSQPLHLLALLNGRSTTNLLRFMIHHPRRWAKLEHVPQAEQQLVWDTVIKLLEQYNMMQSSPQLQQFAWHVPYSIQWHVVIHALDILRAQPFHTDAEKAWRLIDTLYANNLEMLLDMKRPIFVAVGNLCLKAFKSRETVAKNEGEILVVPPDYIIKLRQQRNVIQPKQTGLSEKSSKKHKFNHEHSGLELQACSNEPAAAAQAQYHSDSARQGNVEEQICCDESENIFSEGSSGATFIDMDAMLGQEYWLETLGSDLIDWTQWDTWVGNIDPMHLNIGALHDH